MKILTDKEAAAIEARKEYYRKWRLDHPDRVQQYQKNYWLKKASKLNSDSDADDNRQL